MPNLKVQVCPYLYPNSPFASSILRRPSKISQRLRKWRKANWHFFFLCRRSQKACNRRFHFYFFIFFLLSSILVECKETNQFAVIQCRGMFDCTGVHSILYTVDCTHVMEQPGMNIFSYILVQGWTFSSTSKTIASSTESVVAISPSF